MFYRRKDFRPMLAAEATDEILLRKLQEGPLLASPKLDGIRGIQFDSGCLSRSLKRFRNTFLQNTFNNQHMVGVDGEFISGNPADPHVFNRTTTSVMSYDAVDHNLRFYLFDTCVPDSPGMSYKDRLEILRQQWEVMTAGAPIGDMKYALLPQTEIADTAHLEIYERLCLAAGYEGIILRDPKSPYKFGRSTQPQGWMMKVKRFKDSEATITGFEPLMQNNNEAVVDNLGLQKRSSSKAGKVAQEELGKFLCHDPTIGWSFAVGSGFDDSMREDFWKRRDSLKGKTLTYKYLPHGSIDAPRHPIFKGLRDPIDM